MGSPIRTRPALCPKRPSPPVTTPCESYSPTGPSVPSRLILQTGHNKTKRLDSGFNKWKVKREAASLYVCSENSFYVWLHSGNRYLSTPGPAFVDCSMSESHRVTYKGLVETNWPQRLVVIFWSHMKAINIWNILHLLRKETAFYKSIFFSDFVFMELLRLVMSSQTVLHHSGVYRFLFEQQMKDKFGNIRHMFGPASCCPLTSFVS